jgi:hypothetical protein
VCVCARARACVLIIDRLVQRKREAAREEREAVVRREQRKEHRLEEAELAKRKVM